MQQNDQQDTLLGFLLRVAILAGLGWAVWAGIKQGESEN